MQTSLTNEQLSVYLRCQIEHHFPDNVVHEGLSEIVNMALEKVCYCFSYVNLKHYYRNKSIYFNHLNSDQYTVFIYYASYIAHKEFGDEILASKLFCLNKSLNQFHCMYDTLLPDVFVLIHSGGIVLGKANYGDFMVVSHHCTVGANADLEYPQIGSCSIMYPYSSIIGKSDIGAGACFANSAYVNDVNIDSNRIIFGRSPDLTIKENRKNRIDYFFKNHGAHL